MEEICLCGLFLCFLDIDLKLVQFEAIYDFIEPEAHQPLAENGNRPRLGGKDGNGLPTQNIPQERRQQKHALNNNTYFVNALIHLGLFAGCDFAENRTISAAERSNLSPC